MNKLNMVIMGKTGAGKSTLLNAILGEKLAPTGKGQAITRENKLYSKKLLLPIGKKNNDGHYSLVGKEVNLYDTVGLEIDQNITNATLQRLSDLITEAKSNENNNDVTVVLFCVSYRSSRFETYEVELIKKLTIDYEIPFLVVLTQCIDDEEGQLGLQIRKELPEIKVVRVLAEDYKIKGGVIDAYGIDDLLRTAICSYDDIKIKILEAKLELLSIQRDSRIQELKEKGKKSIEFYTDKALKIGFVPVGCIPVVHGMCIKMIVDLNRMVGLDEAKGFATDIFADAVVGVIATPFMAVPLFSAVIASAYIASVGETYLDSLIAVIEKSKDSDLVNNELMAQRIKEELNKRKKKEE